MLFDAVGQEIGRHFIMRCRGEQSSPAENENLRGLMFDSEMLRDVTAEFPGTANLDQGDRYSRLLVFEADHLAMSHQACHARGTMLENHG